VNQPREPRLLHVCTVAGSLDFLRGQARYVASHGFEVHVVASPDADALARFAGEEGVATHPVAMTRAITPLADARSLLELVRLVASLAPDIVHAGTPKGGLLGMVAAFVNRVPVRIYHVHGIRGMTARGWRRGLLLSTEWLACHLATRVLCVSASTRDAVVASSLCPADRIVVLGAGSCNGVDARTRFNPGRVDAQQRADLRRQLSLPDDGPVVGFVGRVVREKGIVVLAAAWERLAVEFPALHLLIVGPLEQEDPVPAAALDLLTYHPRVRFVDAVTDPAPYYGVMDVVVLPTYREGLPNVPLEAAAMGLPVVATRVPGCVDAIVDGVTGTLVEPYLAEPLAEAVATYLRSSDLRREHGADGRARVQRDFVPEDIWKGVLGLYRSSLAAVR
jgi:glycosyltransferase involved in cell wall biosynthesis